jgi:hypothetical protein
LPYPSFRFIEGLDLCQRLVLRLPDEQLDEHHPGQAAGGEQEEGAGGAEVVVADEVQLGRQEVRDPPGDMGKMPPILRLQNLQLQHQRCSRIERFTKWKKIFLFSKHNGLCTRGVVNYYSAGVVCRELTIVGSAHGFSIGRLQHKKSSICKQTQIICPGTFQPKQRFIKI